MRYDADRDPDPEAWLEASEYERTRAIDRHHRRDAPHELPKGATGHFLTHMVVETQVARGEAAVVERLEALREEGLSRHEAIHAIGWVLSGLMFEGPAGEAAEPEAVEARYHDALAGLTADRWRAAAAPEKPARTRKIGRNEPCPCGSGKKYKRCCGG